jgi:hypothetical protein
MAGAAADGSMWSRRSRGSPGCPIGSAHVIANSDTIVVELVERSIAGGHVHMARPAVVDVIERELADNTR